MRHARQHPVADTGEDTLREAGDDGAGQRFTAGALEFSEHRAGVLGSPRGGGWIARFKSGAYRRETKLAWADDLHDADGVYVLNFEQTVEAARKWFLDAVRESSGEAPRGGSYSVEAAVRDYLKSLENRGVLVLTAANLLRPRCSPNPGQPSPQHF